MNLLNKIIYIINHDYSHLYQHMGVSIVIGGVQKISVVYHGISSQAGQRRRVRRAGPGEVEEEVPRQGRAKTMGKNHGKIVGFHEDFLMNSIVGIMNWTIMEE